MNASGYGLTFGIHSRIDDRVERVASRIACGNVYVNRNQIGAVVGTQPFGGEGLSGTGPKAGGPRYVARLVRPGRPARAFVPGPAVDPSEAQRLLDAARPAGAPLGVATMPGPTGESNRLTLLGRGVVLCLGPDAEAAEAQATLARESGCAAVRIAPGAGGPGALDGVLPRGSLATLRGVDAVALWGEGGGPARRPPRARGARGQDRAAPRGGRPGRALPDRAPPVHRHHRFRRQRDASGGGRLTRRVIRQARRAAARDDAPTEPPIRRPARRRRAFGRCPWLLPHGGAVAIAWAREC